MKAIALTTFGGPEVLHSAEFPEPHAGPGEVRIRVHAAAVSPADTLIRSGLSAPLRQHPPYIPGLDAAGVIDEVGEGVSARLAPGDRVMAMVNPTRPAGGAYVELLVMPENYVALAPARASHAEAATLPLNGLTARLALDRLALTAGETVAVTGAAGAVGGYAVQLAKADGLRVIADASPADAALVTALGADAVVSRGPDVARRVRELEPAGVDGAVDAAAMGAALLPALRDHGSIAIVRGGTPRASQRGISYVSVNVHDYDGNLGKLDELRALADRGQLTMRVARVLPSGQAGRAHQLLEAGGTRGRLVLDFSGPGRGDATASRRPHPPVRDIRQ
jgi:NADPH:quinone reductase-like Zn-dependent oxidoreductase